jgi:hypothetical protein
MKTSRLAAIAAALLGALSSGCGSLMQAECAEGYTLSGGSCVKHSLNVVCEGGQGAVLGMDFAGVEPGTDEAHLLGNAVFRVGADPVKVLDYRALSEWNASSVTNVVDLIASEAVARHRRVHTTVARDADEAREALATNAFDLFFVHDQAAAPAGALGEIGASWAAPIASFTSGCRDVVVLATAQGEGEMGELLRASGVLAVGDVEPASAADVVVAQDDPLLSGVGASFSGEQAVAALAVDRSAGQTISVVLTTRAGVPVAVHRYW